jgi:alpha/beta superfamily hydrolase
MHTTFATSDGLHLAAHWDLPASAPTGAVVLCHPHPLMGGSMDVPLIRTIATGLTRSGFAVLRFNFRGVGDSEGSWSGGTAEIEDVAAAVHTAETAYPSLPHGLAGWSFGAHTALRWQARSDDDRPYAGIAPPVGMTGAAELPSPNALPPAERLFVVGDRDQFTTVEELLTYASEAGARLEVVSGSDHFFYFREHRVADLVVAHLSEAGSASSEAK